ncbi:MAG TPA: type II toxin-antitoxin system HicB family antitoxin [Terracidiphilus sp.]|nr:type II toxin-antitoxin system HicB family antitoxin [Terracidiphilus sp.]
MEYAVVFERTSTGWSAYVPDLPGLGIAAATVEEAETLIREGIGFHIDGLREDGLPVPMPATQVKKVAIPA